MSGCLMQLVATDIQNTVFPNNFSIELEIIDARTNWSFLLERTHDAIIIDALIIPKNVNLNNIKYIEILIGGQIIYNLPFELIKYNYDIIDDNYYITIPKELFIFDSNNNFLKDNFIIPLTSLVWHDIRFNLKSKDSFSYQIMVKRVFFATEERHKLVQQLQTFNTYQYQELPVNVEIHPTKICTGVYIKTNSPLIEYQLILNNLGCKKITKEMIQYYKFLKYKKELWSDNHRTALYSGLNNKIPFQLINMIDTCIDKTTEYLYFIPFNLLNNNLDGTINFSNIDMARFNIKTEDNKNEGILYIKNVNILRIENGMGGLRFHP